MLIGFEQVTFGYGGLEILKGADFQVNRGERIGLVGPNGSGKSTVLRLLAGRIQPHEGRVVRTGGVRVSYLAQDEPDRFDGTLGDSLRQAFAEVVELRERLTRVGELLAQRPEDEGLLAELGEIQTRLEHLDGYDLEARLAELASDLGFAESDFDRPMSSLSGGERCRVALVKALLGQPDVLLLDEPTNHLDIVGTENLERILASYPGTVVLVSHDRAFLNAVCTRIAELVDGQIVSFPGGFDRYERLRQERIEALEREIAKKQALVAKLKDYIARNHAGQKAAQAKSRKRALERLDEIQIPRDPWIRASQWAIRFQVPEPPGPKEIVRAEGVSVGYDPAEPVVHDLDLRVFRGDRIGIVGPNGSGKSTLLRVLCGRQSPLSGRLKIAEDVSIGFFDQTRTDVRDTNTLIEEVLSVAGDLSEQAARGILGRLRFSEEDARRPVASLSGGEKNRLALGKLARRPWAVLALDEPTNHLDIPARQALERALEGYAGTLLVVSHDRYFLDRVVTRILAIMPDGRAVIYHGTYSEFRSSEAGRAFAFETTKAGWTQKEPQAALPPRREESRAERIEQRRRAKARKRKLQRLERRIQQVEEEIDALEEQLEELTQRIAAHAQDWQELQRLEEDRRQLEQALAGKMAEWEDLSEELEQARVEDEAAG